MKWRPAIDDVLQDLYSRGVQCGMAAMPGGGMRAWIEVDGALIEGFLEPPPLSDEIACWLKATAEEVPFPSDPLHGHFPTMSWMPDPGFCDAAEHVRQRRRSLLKVTSNEPPHEANRDRFLSRALDRGRRPTRPRSHDPHHWPPT